MKERAKALEESKDKVKALKQRRLQSAEDALISKAPEVHVPIVQEARPVPEKGETLTIKVSSNARKDTKENKEKSAANLPEGFFDDPFKGSIIRNVK